MSVVHTTRVARLRSFLDESIGAGFDPAMSRRVWPVLLTLVVNPSSRPADLTDDLPVAIYATAVAAEFLHWDTFALPRPDFAAPSFPTTAAPAGKGVALATSAALPAGQPAAFPSSNFPTAAGPGAPSRTGTTSQQKWDGEPVGISSSQHRTAA